MSHGICTPEDGFDRFEFTNIAHGGKCIGVFRENIGIGAK